VVDTTSGAAGARLALMAPIIIDSRRRWRATPCASSSTPRSWLYTEATRIIHEDKPWLELFQEVIIDGVSKRITFKPRAEYHLIVSEMTVSAR